MKIKLAIAASSLALLLSGCFGGNADSEKDSDAGVTTPTKEDATEQETSTDTDVKVDDVAEDKKDVEEKDKAEKTEADEEENRYNYFRHASPIEVEGREVIKEDQAEFKEMKNVEAVEVFEQNGTVFAEVNVKKDATDKDIKEMTTTTVDKLKKKHPKKPITVTVVKDEEKVSDVSVDRETEKGQAAKTVGSVNGLSVLDPILQTYIIRIAAEEVPDAKPEDTLLLTVKGEDYVLEYDKERDLYQNSIIAADNLTQVKNATFIIQSK